ncbi:EI24 domain-containing protein [Parerythrobacter aestuarii]|uniref:EI24 domain-containing protein n=1 Tax=Parerythrobacter aestuarii TaxID=3020909 RepID=UPI0024DDFB85|nr:EI24 domain-containing protein [Parerythrobacter aestuarii]
MMSLPTALARAVGQLADPSVLRVLAKSIAITLGVFVLAGWLLLTGLYAWLVSLGSAFSAELSAIAAVLLTAVAGWLAFRIVALAVLQFFADEIVLAVERRHYPAAAATARVLPFREDLQNSLKGLGRAILFNALALPVALVLLFTAIGPAVVFFFVNAVLLGRELTEMAWLRHRASSDETIPLGGATRFLLGASVACLLIVPFLNLLAPVIGAAAATHMVQGRKDALTHA